MGIGDIPDRGIGHYCYNYSGLIGLLLIIISFLAGVCGVSYLASIISLSIIGAFVYCLKSPSQNLILFIQKGLTKFTIWIIWVLISQGITWSFFYWLGSLL